MWSAGIVMVSCKSLFYEWSPDLAITQINALFLPALKPDEPKE
jgi:hypothetical protein